MISQKNEFGSSAKSFCFRHKTLKFKLKHITANYFREIASALEKTEDWEIPDKLIPNFNSLTTFGGPALSNYDSEINTL